MILLWYIFGLRRDLARLPDFEAKRRAWQQISRSARRYFENLWWPTLLNGAVFAASAMILILLAHTLPALSFLGEPKIGGVFAAATVALANLPIVLAQRHQYQQLLREKLNEWGYATCTHCGYDLTGVTSRKCPECGWARMDSAG